MPPTPCSRLVAIPARCRAKEEEEGLFKVAGRQGGESERARERASVSVSVFLCVLTNERERAHTHTRERE
jgi:hypothetical protein